MERNEGNKTSEELQALGEHKDYEMFWVAGVEGSLLVTEGMLQWLRCNRAKSIRAVLCQLWYVRAVLCRLWCVRAVLCQSAVVPVLPVLLSLAPKSHGFYDAHAFFCLPRDHMIGIQSPRLSSEMHIWDLLVFGPAFASNKISGLDSPG